MNGDLDPWLLLAVVVGVVVMIGGLLAAGWGVLTLLTEWM